MKAINISVNVMEKYREKWDNGSTEVNLNAGEVIGVVSWVKESYLCEKIEIGNNI